VGEQTWVTGSVTLNLYRPPSRLKMLFGWSEEIGSVVKPGLTPVSIAGTARPVKSPTVVLLRYQVDCAASAANPGNRFASIRLPD
jgi:hypothetical protein